MKCFKPKDTPSKRELLLELQKARVVLEQENSGLKVRVTDLRRQLDAFQKDKQSWGVFRSDLEGALQHRSQRSSQLLTRVTLIKAQLADAISAAASALAQPSTVHLVPPQKGAVPPDQAGPSTSSATPGLHASRTAAQLTSKQGSRTETPVARDAALGVRRVAESFLGSVEPVGDDLAAELSKPSVDSQTGAALQQMERQLGELLASHTATLKELEISRAQSQELERELATAQRQGENSKVRAKSQMSALELRCGALESESEGLNEIRSDMQEHLLRLQQDLTKLRTQSGVDQAALCEAHALAQHSSVTVNSAEAELLVKQTAADAAALEATQRQAQLLQLTEQANLASQESAESRAALLRSDAQLQASEAGMKAAAEQLQALLREVEASRGQVYVLQAEALLSVQEMSACRLELAGLSTQLGSSRVELSAREREVTATTARLQDTLQRHTAATAAQQAAVAELSECQQELQDSKAQYIATKSKLIGTSKQLADVAKDHSSAIELLHDSDTTASDATHRATEATHRLGVVTERLNVASEQLGLISERESAASAELGYLRGVHATVVAELRRHHTLLAALARLPQQGIKESEGGDVDTYASVVSEQSLRLKVCESSLPVCAAVAAGVLDSSCLSHLVLDLDISREAVWEKAALRIASLAAALGLSKSVGTLELVGWTWEEMGNGTCAPFLALAGIQPQPPPLPRLPLHSNSQRNLTTTVTPHAQVPASRSASALRRQGSSGLQAATEGSLAQRTGSGSSAAIGASLSQHSRNGSGAAAQSSVSLSQLQQRSSGGGSGGSSAVAGTERLSTWAQMRVPSPGFSCVSVDTRLFDVEACVLLRELLMGGMVELKKPDGSGILKLSASAHPKLDAWYNAMIKHATLAPLSSSTRAPLLRLTTPTPTELASVSDTFTASSSIARTASGSSSTLASITSKPTSRSTSITTTVPLDLLPPGLPRSGSRSFLPAPSQASQISMAGDPVLAASSGVSAEPPSAESPVDCDLSNEALESHHCVMVMVVLLACPHLRRLQLDGNKIGDLGAELLGMGLQYNEGCRVLGLARNAIKAGGARKLARALEVNQGLRTLDLEGQRLEGLGPAGAEALATMLRVNTTLQELNMRGSNIGSAGATALATALRAADGGVNVNTASVERGGGSSSSLLLSSGLQRLCVGLASVDAAAARALQAVCVERGGNLVVS